MSRSARRIEAVLFDFDHTLGIDKRLEEGVLRDLSSRYCGSPLSDDAIAAALLRFRTGEVGLSTMLAHAFAACAPPSDLLHAYKAEALARVPRSVVAFPGCADMLDGLRERGVKTAILTNGWTELQRAKAAAIGFDGPVFVSEEIGAWKPDTAAFLFAAQRVGVAAGVCAYLGDSPVVDVQGSMDAGLIAIWADLERRTYPQDVRPPDYRIETLGDLLRLPVLKAR